MTTHSLSLRGGKHGRHGNPSCLEGHGRTVRFAYRGPVDRHTHRVLAIISKGKLLAFLETYTEAYAAVAVAGGEGVALS